MPHILHKMNALHATFIIRK